MTEVDLEELSKYLEQYQDSDDTLDQGVSMKPSDDKPKQSKEGQVIMSMKELRDLIQKSKTSEPQKPEPQKPQKPSTEPQNLPEPIDNGLFKQRKPMSEKKKRAVAKMIESKRQRATEAKQQTQKQTPKQTPQQKEPEQQKPPQKEPEPQTEQKQVHFEQPLEQVQESPEPFPTPRRLKPNAEPAYYEPEYPIPQEDMLPPDYFQPQPPEPTRPSFPVRNPHGKNKLERLGYHVESKRNNQDKQTKKSTPPHTQTQPKPKGLNPRDMFRFK